MSTKNMLNIKKPIDFILNPEVTSLQRKILYYSLLNKTDFTNFDGQIELKYIPHIQESQYKKTCESMKNIIYKGSPLIVDIYKKGTGFLGVVYSDIFKKEFQDMHDNNKNFIVIDLKKIRHFNSKYTYILYDLLLIHMKKTGETFDNYTYKTTMLKLRGSLKFPKCFYPSPSSLENRIFRHPIDQLSDIILINLYIYNEMQTPKVYQKLKSNELKESEMTVILTSKRI